jgi:hypothetical protein
MVEARTKINPSRLFVAALVSSSIAIVVSLFLQVVLNAHPFFPTSYESTKLNSLDFFGSVYIVPLTIQLGIYSVLGILIWKLLVKFHSTNYVANSAISSGLSYLVTFFIILVLSLSDKAGPISVQHLALYLILPNAAFGVTLACIHKIIPSVFLLELAARKPRSCSNRRPEIDYNRRLVIKALAFCVAVLPFMRLGINGVLLSPSSAQSTSSLGSGKVQGRPLYDYVIWHDAKESLYRSVETLTGLMTSQVSFLELMSSIVDRLCTPPSTGGKIFVKKGTYLPEARLDFPDNDELVSYAEKHVWIEIEGEDTDQTIFKCTVPRAHIIQPRCNFVVRNLTLDGNFISASGVTTKSRIRFEAYNIVVKRCGKGDPNLNPANYFGFGIWLGNRTFYGHGQWISGVRSFLIMDCKFIEQNSSAEDLCPTCTEWGIVTRCFFDRTHADSMGYSGSQLTGGSGNNWYCSFNTLLRNPGNNLGITKELNGDERNVQIFNNVLTNSRILIGSSRLGDDSVLVRNVEIRDNTISGGNITIQGPDRNSAGLPITDPAIWRNVIKDVKVRSNTITNSYYRSIKLQRCENVELTKNVVKNANTGGLPIKNENSGLILARDTYNCTIRDNTLILETSETGYGINYRDSGNLVIIDNTIKNRTMNPTYVDAGKNLQINDNDI